MLEQVFGPGLNNFCDNLIAGTFGISSLIALLGFAGELTNHHNQSAGRLTVSPLVTAMVVLSCFFILVAPRDGTSLSAALSLSNGLLVSLIVASIGGSIFLRLSRMRSLRMPLRALNNDPVVGDVFSVMPAGMLTVLLFAGAKELLSAIGISSITEALAALLSAPFAGATDSLGLAIAYIATTQVLWLFGAHGPNILSAVQDQLLIPATIANNTAVVTGQSPEFIFTSSFFDVFTRIGGSGGTLSLIVATAAGQPLGGIKKFALIAIVPALCNVNEPILLGMPLVLNPIYAIPFVLTPLASDARRLFRQRPGCDAEDVFQHDVDDAGAVERLRRHRVDCRNDRSASGSYRVGIAIYAPFVILADRASISTAGTRSRGCSTLRRTPRRTRTPRTTSACPAIPVAWR